MHSNPSKPSYRQAAEELGKGILLLTCQHSVFGEVELAQVQEGLVSFSPSNDHQFFNLAYCEYQKPGEPRDYMVVYPVRHTIREVYTAVVTKVRAGTYPGPLSSISISFGASFSCAWLRDLIRSTENPVTASNTTPPTAK